MFLHFFFFRYTYRFNLELHLVHQSTDGKIAVVGIMYKIGRPDSLLSLVIPHILFYDDINLFRLNFDVITLENHFFLLNVLSDGTIS